MIRSSGKVWLGAQISRRAMVGSLAGMAIMLLLTGFEMTAMHEQLGRIDAISAQQVLIERQISDLRSYATTARHLSLASEGTTARQDLVTRLDLLTTTISARQDTFAFGQSAQGTAASLDYSLAKLFALTALTRNPTEGLPIGDIVEQIGLLAGVDLNATLRDWADTLSADAADARGRIRFALITLAGIVLLASLSLWLFVLRPLSRTVLDGTEHARALEDALAHTAGHDRLTGLPNRTRSAELIDRHITRRRKESVGLIHLNLCHFHMINEELGHEAGDQVLVETARRLLQSIGEREFVARIGGDEFLIFATDVPTPDNLMARAAALRRTVREPFDLAQGARHMDCVIGAVWSATGTTDAESLSVRADIALRSTLSGEEGPLRLFTQAMMEEVALRDALSRELRRALEKKELVAFFQPQVSAQGGEVTGFEALIRWNHPTRGLLSPAKFLKTAEELGLADQIGAHMLDQALDAWQGWAAAGFAVPHVAVNYSAAQLADILLADRIKWALEQRDLPVDCLALEVVETVAIETDDALAVRIIRNLAEAGFAIELDDFGTGHASIANIQRLRASRIKIDRSFVSGIDQRQDLSVMADAMVRMATALGVSTIAEGVETAEERAKVTALGCTSLQGYNIARPMAFEDTLQWLAEHRMLNHGRRRGRAASA